MTQDQNTPVKDIRRVAMFDTFTKNDFMTGGKHYGKQYLLASLFNAPATMDSYYRAMVNHDLDFG